MKKIMVVFGTRPDAIKMIPLYLELKKYNEFDVKLCSTGQHKEMIEQVLEMFNVQVDYDLKVMQPNQTLENLTSNIIQKMRDVLQIEKPDVVLVHGDTATGFATALASFYQKIKIGHVEAGLRSFDKYSPFPEEMNRVLISDLADYHFAPTKQNVQNLLNEGIRKENVAQTGNTVIDVIKYTVKENYHFEEQKLEQIDYRNNRVILVTAHRRENIGIGLENICDALNEITRQYQDVKVVYPVHLNPKVREIVLKKLKNNSNIILVDPLGVRDLHNLINKCYLVATDSGGIQEEAPALGKPVLVLRKETERPEAIEAGTVKLVGNETENIVKEIKLLMDYPEEYEKMAKAVNPYGDGNASHYIAEFLLKKLEIE